MRDETISGTPGERIRRLRERRGLTRAVLAGLCGRSPEWLKKIESGERKLHSIKQLVLLAQALRAPDISVLTGEGMPLPLSAWDRATHPAVEGVRAAMQAAVLATPADDTPAPDEMGRRVEAAWRRWHRSAHNRTETGAESPELIRQAHACLQARDSSEGRREAYATLASLYRLVQRFLAWLGDSELYWIAVERGRAAAEASDDPLAMSASAWSMAMAMRADGYVDEALRVNARGTALVAPRLEERDPAVLAAYGRLALQAAVSCGLDGRGGEAWSHLNRAEEAAKALPRGFWDAECCFSMSNVQVHAASIGVGLHAPAEVITRAEQVDADAIPSVERRSRFLLDMALAYDERKESVSALTVLRKAFDETPENIRYVPQGRSLAGELARTVKGPMSREAHALAAAVGVAAE